MRGSDRALLVWMARLCPGLLELAQVARVRQVTRLYNGLRIELAQVVRAAPSDALV
jgi:hypothetical protein